MAPGAAAQTRNKADAFAFFTYLQGVGVRHVARSCERRQPDYRKQFDDLYAGWAKKNRAALVRGEALFKEARRNNWPGENVDREKLDKIGLTVDALETEPADRSPLPPNEDLARLCQANLDGLKEGQ